MATRPDSGSPWPHPTPHASSSKGKRKWDPATSDQPPHRFRKVPRQNPAVTGDSDNCGIVSNDVISCFPTADSIIVQNQWTRLVWNKALPQFSQTNLVDVYLFHGDSDKQVFLQQNIPYSQGHLSVQVTDTWWGPQGDNFTPGKNQTQNFFFLLVRNGAGTLSATPQATFTATQTAFPNSILSSQSSASLAAASSASSASAASSKSASSSAASSASSSSSANSAAAASSAAALQNGSNSGNDFPHWAIALLAVFGFLAFVSVLFVFWLLIRNLRNRKRNGLAHRNSIGSQSPMMANMAQAQPQSPTNAAPGSSIAHGDPHSTESGIAPLPAISNRHNIVSSDGASTVSRADSAGGPFSAVDAAAMAAAFRNVMRKPDFADRPMEEGESPEHKDADVDVLNRELAEEGRDIRSVSSSRGVKVETLSDSGDTAH